MHRVCKLRIDKPWTRHPFLPRHWRQKYPFLRVVSVRNILYAFIVLYSICYIYLQLLYRHGSIAPIITAVFTSAYDGRSPHDNPSSAAWRPDFAVVVSLTTSPKRMDKILQTIQSLVNQSLQPDRIYLNIPRGRMKRHPELSYDEVDIPPQVLALAPLVTINRCEDEGPATKLLGALRLVNVSDTLIITVDDDFLYPRDLVRSLAWEATLKPEDVIGVCGWGMVPIFWHAVGIIPAYVPYFMRPYGRIVDILQACCGNAYRRGFFRNVEELSDISSDCLTVDDIWLAGYLTAVENRKSAIISKRLDPTEPEWKAHESMPSLSLSQFNHANLVHYKCVQAIEAKFGKHWKRNFDNVISVNSEMGMFSKCDGDVVVPGEIIATGYLDEDDTITHSGLGTYATATTIHASIVGTLKVTESGQVTVYRNDKTIGSAQVLRLGDHVLCKVVKISNQQVSVNILCIGDTVLQESFLGTIRIEDVRSRDVDKLVLESIFAPGMLVKAVVLSYGDTRSYFLSTASSGLGVIRSIEPDCPIFLRLLVTIAPPLKTLERKTMPPSFPMMMYVIRIGYERSLKRSYQFYDAYEDIHTLEKSALDKTLDDDTKHQDEKMDRYTVKNNDTGEIYDIRKIDPQMETYSMFPNDFISLMNNPSDSNKQTKSRPPLRIGLKFGKRGKTRELKRNHVAVLASKKEKRDFQEMVLIQKLCSHNGTIWTMQFSCDGSHLATGGQDTILRLWKVQMSVTESNERRTGCDKQIVAPAQVYQGHRMPIVDISWSRSNFILSASMDKTVRLWHISREDCLHVFQHPDSVPAVHFHPKEDRYFLSGCFDNKARVWDIPDGCVISYVQTPVMITAACYNPSGNRAIVGLLNGQCIFYQVNAHQQMNYYTQIECRNSRGPMKKGRKVTGIEFDPEGKCFMVSTNDSRMRLFSVDNYSRVCKYKGLLNDHLQIKGRFSQDGDYVICGSENGNVYIWNKQTFLSSSLMKSGKHDRNASYEYFCAAESTNGIVTVALFAPASAHAMVKSKLDTYAQHQECTGLIVTASYDGCINFFESVP
ncbi:unnamed protein product [Albugo candida]|uniref:Uncharacterized protein n=1 Tax=Albugo candida TaxID=65357 RepID=A0A024GIR6_9STRA|nr:unnamed protein product [Albugo candida]|eukprot:CCI46596.1 unnamed protein product [Albugo candida]